MISCMIVDDEPLAVQLLEDYIAQSGSLRLAFKCYHAMDALRFLKQQPVDLIFMDINMPKLTGMELASCFRLNRKLFLPRLIPNMRCRVMRRMPSITC